MNQSTHNNSSHSQEIADLKALPEESWKEAEHWRREAIICKAQLSAILNNANETSFFSIDKSYNYLAFNEKHRSYAGEKWGAGIRVGSNFPDIIPDKTARQDFKTRIDRALQGESFREETSDDRLNHFHETCWNPVTVEGIPIGVTVTTVDVSQYKVNLRKIKKLKRLRYGR
jgi:hypothetical protein